MYQNLFSPNYLRELCRKFNLTPSKRYGQNFLISQSPIKKMIEVADLKKTDTVMEIGPGFGVLTLALAERAGKVVAFEIEKKLIAYWREQQPDNVEIIWGNALNELKVESRKLKVYKVVANLPYQITSHVLRTLLELENKPVSITMMVQKEVAERIVAKPGKMSLLAVAVQYYGQPKIVTQVSKGNFWPQPKVDSVIVYINTKTHKHKNTFSKAFFKVVKAGFSNKRKQLWRNLSLVLKIAGDMVKNVLQEVCGNKKIRAEELSVADWQEVVKRLNTPT